MLGLTQHIRVSLSGFYLLLPMQILSNYFPTAHLIIDPSAEGINRRNRHGDWLFFVLFREKVTISRTFRVKRIYL